MFEYFKTIVKKILGIILKLAFWIGIMQKKQEVTKEQKSFSIIEGTFEKYFPDENEITEFLPSYYKSYCQVQFGNNTIDYIWKLNNYAKILKLFKTVLSMPFPETAQYRIQMETSMVSSWWSSLIKFYIVTEVPFNGICNVFVINKHNKLSLNSISGVISNMTLLYETSLEDLWNELDNNTLTMNFMLEIFHECLNDTVHINSPPLSSILTTNLKSQNPTLDAPDDTITFIINGEYFDISKELLHNTKCVEYFCNRYKENNIMANNLITINDNDLQEVLKIILFYLETGLIAKQFNYCTTKTLLEIANGCDLQDIKVRCEDYLIHKITVNSVVELIQLALLNNAEHLEKHAASFIKFHLQEIICTKEFQSLSQEQLNKIIKSIEKIETFKISESM